ncbi:MAG: HD-GYP domain-containing protein [Spirochaetaceae bacterium]
MNLISVQKALQKDRRLHRYLLLQEEPVLCFQKSTNKKKKVSFRALIDNNPTFWKTAGSWSFYFLSSSVDEALEEIQQNDEHIQNETFRRQKALMELKEKELTEKKLSNKEAGREEALTDVNTAVAGEAPPANFSKDYEYIRSLSPDEKGELIYKDTHRLNRLLADPARTEEEVGEALSDSAKDSTLANKTILEEALKMGDTEAKAFTRDIVEKTKEMIKSSTSLIDETVLKDELFNAIMQKSNGTVVQHMTRTYLRSVSFLLFYNNKLLKTSFANKIRGQFPAKYREYYWKLLPHFHKEDVILERVFQSGLQAVPADQVNNFATGFLVHDVGKAKDIEYHEGTEAYDRKKVVDHIRQGYTAIMHKTDYPPQAGLITGYHHEYYGHPSGYGFHRALYLRHKQKNPKFLPGYCISYTVEGVLTFQALAYFPAKILEIIDIFDALTDPNRAYRAPLSKEEALELMQEQFIDENLKIDPILFHIFREHMG